MYIAPAVEEYWEHMKNDLWRELGEMMGEMIHMGRHGIKVYFRDEDNRCQEGEGRKSPNIERVGFEIGLDGILKSKRLSPPGNWCTYE